MQANDAATMRTKWLDSFQSQDLEQNARRLSIPLVAFVGMNKRHSENTSPLSPANMELPTILEGNPQAKRQGHVPSMSIGVVTACWGNACHFVSEYLEHGPSSKLLFVPGCPETAPNEISLRAFRREIAWMSQLVTSMALLRHLEAVHDVNQLLEVLTQALGPVPDLGDSPY